MLYTNGTIGLNIVLNVQWDAKQSNWLNKNIKWTIVSDNLGYVNQFDDPRTWWSLGDSFVDS